MTEFINRNHDAWVESDMWDLIGRTIEYVVKRPDRKSFNGNVIVSHGYNIHTTDGFIYGIFPHISGDVTKFDMIDVLRMVGGNEVVRQQKTPAKKG
jgi:hypothetical protein